MEVCETCKTEGGLCYGCRSKLNHLKPKTPLDVALQEAKNAVLCEGCAKGGAPCRVCADKIEALNKAKRPPFRKASSVPLVNGLVFGNATNLVALLYIHGAKEGEGKWGLMSICEHVKPELTAPIFKSRIDGVWKFFDAEVYQMLEGYVLAPFKLEFVKHEEGA